MSQTTPLPVESFETLEEKYLNLKKRYEELLIKQQEIQKKTCRCECGCECGDNDSREKSDEINRATENEDHVDETILPFRNEMSDRYVLFPIKHKDIWTMYKMAESSFWTAEEVDLSKDQKEWEKLSSEEKYFLKMVLAFFAASDGIVLENLAERFLSDVQIPEARAFYSFQIMMEGIHSETYSLLIDTLIKDDNERRETFRALENFDCIRKKAQWAMRWIKSSKSFAERLVAFAAVEGIFFSGSFCSIFWLKKQNKKLHGLFFSNELISKDEGLHTDFACLLYSMIDKKLSQEVVYEIISSAVETEEIFVSQSLPVSLIAMNKDLMIQYIRYVADRLLKSLGYELLYKVENPFDWMMVISLPGKTDFFERRVSDYSMSNVNTSTRVVSNADETFKPLDDF